MNIAEQTEQDCEVIKSDSKVSYNSSHLINFPKNDSNIVNQDDFWKCLNNNLDGFTGHDFSDKNKYTLSDIKFEKYIQYNNFQKLTVQDSEIKGLLLGKYSTKKYQGASFQIINNIEDKYNFDELHLSRSIIKLVYICNIENKKTFITETNFKINIIKTRFSIFNDFQIYYFNFLKLGTSVFKDETIISSKKDSQFLFIYKSDFEKSLTIQDTKISFLKIKNTTFKKDSKLHLKNLKVKSLTLSNITQEWSEAIFENIIIPKGGKLKLENVDLQKAKFVDCDFSECEIEIKNSVSFKDTLFNSVEWGNISRIEAKRDIFRQLKFSNDSQGNFIDANNFYSEEMRKYKQGIYSKDSKSSFQEKAIFWLNETISNFGQSWFLPIFWFFVITMGILIGIDLLQKFSIDYEKAKKIISIILIYGVFLSPFIMIFFNFLKKLLIVPILLLILFETFPYYIVTLFLVILYFILGIEFNEIAKFSIPKFNKDEYQHYEFIWFLHKAILSILIYHLTIALRRQTKR